ncbi:unnamed protein product, partial [Polarella glacialis]
LCHGSPEVCGAPLLAQMSSQLQNARMASQCPRQRLASQCCPAGRPEPMTNCTRTRLLGELPPQRRDRLGIREDQEKEAKKEKQMKVLRSLSLGQERRQLKSYEEE